MALMCSDCITPKTLLIVLIFRTVTDYIAARKLFVNKENCKKAFLEVSSFLVMKYVVFIL